MKKLQCEICGGALVMQDGMAVCESCGMKFSKDEVKKMVVELSGPIQIDGEVKVSGVEDADVLYRRAKDYERIGELGDAYYTYSCATEKYPGDGRLWLGLATAQVKVKLKKCEEQLLSNSYCYSDYELRDSFMDSKWCDEIEKYYKRAQSLGGVDDEAQQGLLWFRNQKEPIIQKYKDSKKRVDTYAYWRSANTKFLNTFPSKDDVLAFLLKLDAQDKNKFRKELRGRIQGTGGEDFYSITYFREVRANYISFGFRANGWQASGVIYLPEGMTIEGDIRPMMDGFTYKEKGLFGGKKTYSYANDPDKDKGPTFDE